MENIKKYKNTFIVTIIMCAIIIFSIIYNFYFHKNIRCIYNYTAQKSDDYEVLLKPNNFYETEILESGSYYAAKSIDNYIINLKYDFLGNKKANLEYDYNIDAYLVGIVKNEDNEDKEVWNRKFILKDNSHDKKDDIDKISINQQVKIDYAYYNNLARSYEKTYGITIESVLKVRLNILCNINLEENINKVEDFIELEIPITNTISEIKENYEKVTNGEIIQEQGNNRIKENIVYIIGGVIFIGLSTIMILIIIKYIKLKKQEFNGKLKHILKYYKDIIIIINKEPNLDNLKVINLCNFEDLVNLVEQTQRNILYYENASKKERKFFVIIDNYIYIYLLKDSL